MPTFTYRGQTKEGHAVTETVEAADRFAVYDVARQNGHEVLSIAEAKRFSLQNLLNMDRVNAFLSSVKQDELVMFTRNLSAMLKAGLPLSRALSVAERQTKNVKLRQTLISVREGVNTGKQLNEVIVEFPRIFSKLYVAMVRAGEEGGTLSEALTTIGVQLQQSSNIKKKIRGAMMYPAIVVSVMCIIGVLMMIYVVPTLTATFKELDVDLPASTRTIIWLSDAFSQHASLMLLAIAGGVGSIILAFRTPPGRKTFEWVLLRLPIIGNLAKETNAARTARTLSSLLASGVDVVGALNITKDVVQNSFYRTVIADAALQVEKGRPLSESFVQRPDLYPILVGEMIAVGEETGQISNMLVEVANFYEDEIERKTKDLSTIIEPVLMVVIGAGVGFFALAMISPIYSISDSI